MNNTLSGKLLPTAGVQEYMPKTTTALIGDLIK